MVHLDRSPALRQFIDDEKNGECWTMKSNRDICAGAQYDVRVPTRRVDNGAENGSSRTTTPKTWYNQYDQRSGRGWTYHDAEKRVQELFARVESLLRGRPSCDRSDDTFEFNWFQRYLKTVPSDSQCFLLDVAVLLHDAGAALGDRRAGTLVVARHLYRMPWRDIAHECHSTLSVVRRLTQYATIYVADHSQRLNYEKDADVRESD